MKNKTILSGVLVTALLGGGFAFDACADVPQVPSLQLVKNALGDGISPSSPAAGKITAAKTAADNAQYTATSALTKATTNEGSISTLSGKVTTAEGNITNLTTKIGDLGGKTVAEYVAEQQFNPAESEALDTKITAYLGKIDNTDFSSSNTVASKITAAQTTANSALTKATTNETSISTLDSKIGSGFSATNTVASKITAAQTAASNAQTAASNAQTTANAALPKTEAANTYLTKTDATSTYLTKASATDTYLTKTSATSTYQAKGNYATTEALNGVKATAEAAVTQNALNTLKTQIADATLGVTVCETWACNNTTNDKQVVGITLATK